MMPDYNLVNGTYTNLESNMPTNIDNIDRMNDISSNLVSAKNTFESYISNNDFAGAAAVLAGNPELAACLFNADKFNSLRDALIATQLTFVNNASDYIIHAMESKGEYNNSYVYHMHNIVHYNNNYYMAIQDNFSGQVPSNTSYWAQMTIKGDKGETGTGLIPSGNWNDTTVYRYYTGTDGQLHASMVYYNNALYQCKVDNISGSSNSPTNTTAWELIMSLQTNADDIVTDYGYLNEVLLKNDNILDILVLKQSYTYEAYEDATDSYIEIIKDNNIVIAQKETMQDGDNWYIYYKLRKNGFLEVVRSLWVRKVNNKWIATSP